MLSLRLAQAGDLSLLKTMLQQFAAFERLAVTVTEVDLLRDVQIHLPVNESDYLQSRSADSRSKQASIDRNGFLSWRNVVC